MSKVEKTTEVKVMKAGQELPVELDAVIKRSNEIKLVKAQEHAIAFLPSMHEFHEVSKNLSKIDKANPTEDDVKLARASRLKLVKVRTGAGTIKDERKASLVAESNLIQSLHNVVRDSCAVTEGEFLEVEKYYERIEAERIEKLKQERIQKLEPYGTDTTFIDLSSMSDEQFSSLLEREKLAYEAKVEQERQAEIARVEAEKKAEEERKEAERIAKEKAEEQRKENERLKAEAEKLRKEKAEAERIRKVRAGELSPYLIFIRDYDGLINKPEKEYQKELADIKKGAMQKWEYDREKEKEEAEARAKEEAAEKARLAELEKAKREAEKKAQEEKAKAEKAQAEAKKLQEELRAKKEAEELAHEQEKQRIADEEAESIAKARAEALAPDKEKINKLYLAIKNFEFPECSEPDAKKLVEEVKEGFQAILKGIVNSANKIK